MTKAKLSPKQMKFVQQYHLTGHGEKSAIAAGYSPKTARTQASSLLTKPNILGYLSELQQKAAIKHEITAESLTEMIMDDIALARNLEQLGPAMSGRALLARIHGLNQDNIGLKGLPKVVRRDFTGEASDDGDA